MDPAQIAAAQAQAQAAANAASMGAQGINHALFASGAAGMQLPMGVAPTGGLPAAFPAGAAAGLPPGFVLPPAGAGVGVAPLMQVPFQVMNDPVMLHQLTGIDAKLIRDSPGMLMAAQQLLAQRLIHQQFMNAGAVQGIITPQQMQAMQQQRLQQQQQAKAARGKGKGKGGKGGGSKPHGTDGPFSKDDPGGKVIWAKVSSYPWWPAKTLDPSKDRSFPPDADAPRPTAIPVRFFGTHEFAWVGSKRALTEWEEGLAKFSQESDLATFAAAIEEAQTYLKDATLPDAFYIHPEGDNGKKAAKGRKRLAAASYKRLLGEDGTGLGLGIGLGGGVIAPTGAAAPAYGSGKGRSGRGGQELSPEDRAAMVFERKKQRLLELGLLPPENSPFATRSGVVAPNPTLLEMEAAWEAAEPQTMAAAREEVSKPEANAPPRASVMRVPPPVAEGQAAAAVMPPPSAPNANPAAMVGAGAGMFGHIGVGGGITLGMSPLGGVMLGGQGLLMNPGGDPSIGGGGGGLVLEGGSNPINLGTTI